VTWSKELAREPKTDTTAENKGMTCRSSYSLSATTIVSLAIAITACEKPDTAGDFPVLTGPYLGQTPPGDTAELFAPGIVSTGMYTRDVAMTPDGSELYFGVLVGGLAVIMETKIVDGRWTNPEVAPFSSNSEYLNLEPHITPDGQHFYFLSTRPPPGSEMAEGEARTWTNQDIWAMDRAENGWSEPYNPGPPINTEDAEFFPSVTMDGTIYFTRGVEGSQESYIYRSRMVDGEYTEAERLGPNVNSTASQYNAFIAPDESYIIVCSALREDGLGRDDYFIVFRDESDSWSTPINMGDRVNTPRGGEFSPYVSPDGKYFFFMAARPRPYNPLPATLTADLLRDIQRGPHNGDVNIFWIDAGFIEDLRP
jgi:hypothetical protein